MWLWGEHFKRSAIGRWSLDRGTYLPLLTFCTENPSDCHWQHTSCRKTRLVSVRIRTVGLHASSKNRSYTLAVPVIVLSAICRVATLRRRSSWRLHFFFTTRANVSDIFLLGLVLPRYGARVGRPLLARTGIASLWSSVGWMSLFGVHT